MKKYTLVLVLSSLAGLVVGAEGQPYAAVSKSEAARGWIAMFDGRSADGWYSPNGSKWAVYEGMLYPLAGKDTPTLSPATAFDDFDVEIEYRARDGATVNIGGYRISLPAGGIEWRQCNVWRRGRHYDVTMSDWNSILAWSINAGDKGPVMINITGHVVIRSFKLRTK